MAIQLAGAKVLPAAAPKAPAKPDPTVRAARDAQFDRDLAAAGPDSYVKSPKLVDIQRHATYFDLNGDGHVTLGETRKGLEDLNVSPTMATVLSPVINGGLGSLTHPTPGESFKGKLATLFDINLSALVFSLPKGGNGAFDGKGNFAPAKFEHMLSFDKSGKNASLSGAELDAMIDADQQDKAGKIRTKAGFAQLVSVAADTTKTEMVKGVPTSMPALTRERLQSFYDGTLFYRVAAENGHPHALITPGK